MHFTDRRDAGRQLATMLESFAGEDTVVVGLPRGGAPVAAEVADHLHLPLDVLIVRKLGVPHQQELAMGAIGEGGVRVMNQRIVDQARVTPEQWSEVEDREWNELLRRAERLRRDHPRIPLEGKTVIIVDDGLATGSTARAACQVARAANASRVILAVPVAPAGWTDSFVGEADDLVSAFTPQRFTAVGQWYDDFTPTTDDDVVECLGDRS